MVKKPRAWSSRYVAYAKAHDKTPDEMFEHDTERWPGGVMCGFSLWITSMWDKWHEDRDLKRHEHILSDADHASFDQFLEGEKS